MPTEREWVRGFTKKLNDALGSMRGTEVCAVDGMRLAYACEVHKYSSDQSPEVSTTKYETDILVFDRYSDGSWIPRVVIECKLKDITTHDALTYSAKAATHRAVHPYLRYGFLAGQRRNYGIPPRLVRHGDDFDFLLTWRGLKASPSEWRALIATVKREVKTSRAMQDVLKNNYAVGHRKYDLIHSSIRMRKQRH
jgi:hypothetical protein